MTAIEEAALIYERNGLHLGTDIEHHLKHGIVLCLPDRFIIGREIRLVNGMETPCERGIGNAWFVHFAVGRGAIKWFLEQAPRRLPFLCWTRLKHKVQGYHPLHIVSTDRFERIIHHG